MRFPGCMPPVVGFQDYYHERNGTRANHRNYSMSRPPFGMHSHATMGQDEVPMEGVQARRRISVACARCRKRKIRCSGDTPNGAGCGNCRQASIDPAHCQFHRVGSDTVHKVMDNLNIAQSLAGMANSNRMMPSYSGSTPLYARPAVHHQYSQLDTKSMYQAPWTVPFPEDTSPIDTYSLDQPASYLTNPPPSTNTGICGTSYRWKNPHHGTDACFDQESPYSTHSVPYYQTNLRTATTEPQSPLSMAALHLTLPERPHAQPFHGSEITAPQRQLPVPQPSPAQASRNVVDQLQDQRLRIEGSFAKHTLPSNANGDNQINVSDVSRADSQAIATAEPSNTTESAMEFLPTTTSMANDVNSASATPQLQLNFSAPTLLEAMHPRAPTNPYSNFREYRTPGSSSTQVVRQDSSSDLYSFNLSPASKRHSLSEESSDGCTLVSGHRYTPLAPSPPENASGVGNLHRESFENRNVPLHRASISNIRSNL